MRIEFEPEGFQPPKWGMILLQGLVALILFLFVVRFWYLQVVRGEEFARRAHENRNRQELVYATRGLILDDKGDLLAENRPAYALAIIREDCQDMPATLAKISQWTDAPLDFLTAKYLQERARVKIFEPQILVSDISFEQVARIESELINWPGVTVLTRQRRYYPQGDLFAHILGYVAEANEKEMEEDKYLALGDKVGKQGLELTLEKELRGHKGQNQMEVDVLGRQLKKVQTEAPHAGDNINLSLDLGLQKAAENALGQEAGCIVVLDPDTGKLKALVTSPAFDNNAFTARLSTKDWTALVQNPRHPLQNRVIQSVYPPGSVWKIMMAGLILSEGISPKETVHCSGEIKLGNHTFRCWRASGHGNVDLARSLVESCDVYYYHMAERLGIDKIEKYAKACGFGGLTGIDLPHEKGGLVPSRDWKRQRFHESWQKGETLNVAIGQGFTLVTPVQVAMFIGGLLNGGKLLKPSLLADEEPVVRSMLPMTEQIRQTLVDCMRLTVEAPAATAKRLLRPDAIMGGKTGTAQVVRMGEKRVKSSDLSYQYRDHAWMASWGIKDNKKYVVVVMVEHGGGGSSAAGPVCRAVYDYLFGPSPQTALAQNAASKAVEEAEDTVPQNDTSAAEALSNADLWLSAEQKAPALPGEDAGPGSLPPAGAIQGDL